MTEHARTLRAARGIEEALREAAAESKLAYDLNDHQLQLLLFERVPDRRAGARCAARSPRGKLLRGKSVAAGTKGSNHGIRPN
jgi:hypothetical protein